MSAVALMAPSFAENADWRGRPVAELTLALALAGACFLVIWTWLRTNRMGRAHWIAAVFLGLILRISMAASAPILEDDWRRYLWDGAVVAAGLDPYAHPPADGLADDGFLLPPTSETGASTVPAADDIQRRLQSLGAEDPDYPERVSYPYLTTIYPPVAQIAFLVANQIDAFSLTAMRAVFAVADAATFLLLLTALPAFGMPMRHALLYWLNPLVIFETFNASHVDVLIGPFVVSALLFARSGQAMFSGGALAAAAGVKLWPLLLAPLFLRAFAAHRGRFVAFGVALAFGLALFVASMFLNHVGESAGLSAYAGDWTRNAFLFAAAQGAAAEFSGDPSSVARALVALALVVFVAVLAFKSEAPIESLPARALAVAAALFFLSPTGYPWYAIWLFILFPFAPTVGIALLGVTLPLYHLRFLDGAGGDLPFAIRALEFGVPLAVIAVELTLIRRRAWRRSKI